MIISFTGFMGCGKSTVGRMVSGRTAAKLIDLDSYIEASAAMSIPEIFSAEGEAGFRKKELEALKEICGAEHGGLVLLSLGGGTLTTADCSRIISEKTYCIYLRAGAATLVRNLENDSAGRPMLQGDKSLEARVNELLAARAAIYEGAARFIIDIDGLTFETVAEMVIEEINRLK